MEAYRTETTVDTDGELHLTQLPFRPGTGVEVIVLAQELKRFPEMTLSCLPKLTHPKS
jgi:hypothetical protein